MFTAVCPGRYGVTEWVVCIADSSGLNPAEDGVVTLVTEPLLVPCAPCATPYRRDVAG